MTSPVVTVSMAAQRLGLSRRGVLAMIERGKLEPLGKSPGTTGAYLIDAAEVEALAEARAARKEARTA